VTPTMPPPWKLVGRATPFSRWMFLQHSAKLEDAIVQASLLKKRWRLYAVHIRPN
jgi:hypothetical protein